MDSAVRFICAISHMSHDNPAASPHFVDEDLAQRVEFTCPKLHIASVRRAWLEVRELGVVAGSQTTAGK